MVQLNYQSEIVQNNSHSLTNARQKAQSLRCQGYFSSFNLFFSILFNFILYTQYITQLNPVSKHSCFNKCQIREISQQQQRIVRIPYSRLNVKCATSPTPFRITDPWFYVWINIQFVWVVQKKFHQLNQFVHIVGFRFNQKKFDLSEAQVLNKKKLLIYCILIIKNKKKSLIKSPQQQIKRMQVDIQIFQQNNRGFLGCSYEYWIQWTFGYKQMAKLIACFVLWGLALILIGVLPLTDNNSYLNQFQKICLLMGPILLFMCIVILSIQWCMRWIVD